MIWTEMGTLPAQEAEMVKNVVTLLEVELEFWRAIKDGDDLEDFGLYIKLYPDGIYAELARNKIARSQGKVVDPTTERRAARKAAQREAKAKKRVARQEARIEARLAREDAEFRRCEAAFEAARAIEAMGRNRMKS